jgi:hypothetical protein
MNAEQTDIVHVEFSHGTVVIRRQFVAGGWVSALLDGFRAAVSNGSLF